MYPVSDFQQHILAWFAQHGRKDLPWQRQVNAYRVWVSEIMLQQTQVTTVIDYFNRFMQRFGTVNDLAEASLDEVLHLWTGLGYYSRARNLHKTAQTVVAQYQSIFPDTVDELEKLPGIGRSTAGAIVSLAYKKSAAILDGNVKRVFCRNFAIEGWYGNSKVQKRLWELVEHYKPEKNIANYTQALMDLGATICTRSNPKCSICPLTKNCVALRNNLIEQLPTKKPKKMLPIKQTTFLIIANSQNKILLLQRPPTGIWGGLWCFPEMSDKTDINAECQKQLGFQVSGIEAIKQFRHTFSHYHLDIQVKTMQVTEFISRQIAEAKPHCWYDTATPPSIGLAAPVKKLLTELSEELI